MLKSLPLTFNLERLSVFFFFLFFKSAPWGEGLQGMAACGPIRTVNSWRILQTGRYKDKMAARSMRAELSSRTEIWRRSTEFTSLRAGSGDSWPMPSEGKEMKIIYMQSSPNIRNKVGLLFSPRGNQTPWAGLLVILWYVHNELNNCKFTWAYAPLKQSINWNDEGLQKAP